eukprot:scaffold2368_cov289-Chaetoceros_neogracile.AAC.10
MKPKKREVKSQNIHVEVDMSVTMSVRQKGHNIAMRGRNGRQFKKNLCWKLETSSFFMSVAWLQHEPEQGQIKPTRSTVNGQKKSAFKAKIFRPITPSIQSASQSASDKALLVDTHPSQPSALRKSSWNSSSIFAEEFVHQNINLIGRNTCTPSKSTIELLQDPSNCVDTRQDRYLCIKRIIHFAVPSVKERK